MGTYRTSSHQLDSELDAFIEIIREAGTRSFLEIGSKFGGTLWRVANALPAGSRIVSVDIEAHNDLLECVQRLKKLGYDAHLVTGNSMEPITIARVRKFCPFDAVFIDGNHKLMYVRSDWENYGAMARIVGFHDIGWRIESRTKSRIHVPEFWEGIKGAWRHAEIIHQPNANGIGVIWRG